MCSLLGSDRAAAAPRAPRVRKERAPVDPASLDKKRVFIGYLPENVTPENVKAQFAGVVDVQLRGKYAVPMYRSHCVTSSQVRIRPVRH